ncbi:DUF4253 domain-containing protein [Erythrobacter sp. NE805]|uniref:DUF4253 domain-containing protein n=1 Tax=Erythrobacter sp. NE805 TaxID=3389875 RepID=UPI00396B2C61
MALCDPAQWGLAMERRGVMKGLLGGLLALLGAGRGGAKVRQAAGAAAPAVDIAALRAMVGYPVEVVDGAQALARWEALRRAGEGYPVVVGDAEALSFLAEAAGFDDREDPKAILAEAAALQWPQAIFDARRREREAFAAEYGAGEIEEDDEAIVGDWPAKVADAPELTTREDILTGKPHRQCFIVIFPAQHGWEVPAYANWGGWNENPAPALHVAALKSWHERYGAELVGMSGDVMNLRVARKPASRVEALALAREHYAYCADIVEQGMGSLAALAATYLESRWWYFWWD